MSRRTEFHGVAIGIPSHSHTLLGPDRVTEMCTEQAIPWKRCRFTTKSFAFRDIAVTMPGGVRNAFFDVVDTNGRFDICAG